VSWSDVAFVFNTVQLATAAAGAGPSYAVRKRDPKIYNTWNRGGERSFLGLGPNRHQETLIANINTDGTFTHVEKDDVEVEEF
jgi:hypothetical protein